MARHTDADARTAPEFDADTRSSLRNADVEAGDTVRVTVDPEADFETIVGEVTTKYSDEKWAIQVDGDVPDGTAYIVNADTGTVRVGSHRDGFETVDARPVYVETPDETTPDASDVVDGFDADTLVFERVSEHAHERTGKRTKTTETVEHDGEVYADASDDDASLIGFRTDEHDGVFFVLPDETVEYDPHDPDRHAYEVGTNGRIE